MAKKSQEAFKLLHATQGNFVCLLSKSPAHNPLISPLSLNLLLCTPYSRSPNLQLPSSEKKNVAGRARSTSSAASPSSSSSAVSTPQLGFDSVQHQQHQQQQLGSRHDKSWRVWDMVVNQLYKLCDAVGPEATRSDLVLAYVRLQRDNEAEVRIAATGKVSKFCRILNPELAIQQILLPIALTP